MERKFTIRPERFEHLERADYDIASFDREFLERLYSDKGREILRAWERRQKDQSNEEGR